MGPLHKVITIGPNYEKPLIRLTNADFINGGVVTDRGIDFSGKELIIDDLTATVRMNQGTAQGAAFITLDSRAFFTSEGQRFLARLNVPKDRVITGYVDFTTSDGQLLMTSGGEAFQVPVTQDLADFWESMWDGITYGTPVWYETPYEKLKFYWKNYKRTGKYEFSMTAQSDIGILDRQTDNGGMFEGITLERRLSAIIFGVVPYRIDNEIASIPIYGWQPVQSKREAIQELIHTYGIVIRRDSNGSMFFTLPPTEEKEIEYGKVFLGGSVDRNDDKKYSRIDVTEHTFLQTATDRELTLYDNTDGSGIADNLKVTFAEAPVYNLAAEGLQILESGVNYAIVSGVGKLTGKQYTHVTQIASVEGISIPYAENVLKSDSVALISYLNSQAVAERLRDYFNAEATVTMDFIRTGQNPGDLVRFTDPYGKERTGYLTAVKSKATSFDRAKSTVVVGYTPGTFGNTYNESERLTGSGTWSVPAKLDGKTIRVVLISGGQGGESGAHGTDDNAEGGQPGKPGSGGRIRTVNISVRAGEIYAYQCGAGGAGGTPTDDVFEDEDGNKTYINNPGAMGGASVFGAYSSDGGASSDRGYQDIIHGNQYALAGPDYGVAGGKATTGKESRTGLLNMSVYEDAFEDRVYPTVTASWLGTFWYSGYVGESGYHREIESYQNEEYESFYYAFGGMGGGAAVGEQGGGGGAANLNYADYGGPGGAGADAQAIFPVNDFPYGSGGSGGHGGGEGGMGGTAYYEGPRGAKSLTAARGAGGSGSAGQHGQPGCIIIYY